ncbi:MAG TPA: agmatine deiminase family protein [Flavobacteriales bacterium]|nr:agmatine deiminase family protein [Flavobacteriales bacterium]
MSTSRYLALLASVFLGAVTPAFAQESLPHSMAPQERALIPVYREGLLQGHRGEIAPPPFAVRTMAEWEEVESVVIAWRSFPGILKQIVRYALDECRVIIACDDPAAVEAYLGNAEYGGPIEDLSGVTYLTADINSIWSRDYFAESIYANEVDSLLLLDWIYNRPRPADDVLSDVVGAAEGIAVYGTTQAPFDLVHTGGNFMCDGAGTAFSSALVLDENGPGGDFNFTVRDEAGVNAVMQQFMGIDHYIIMPTLPFDGIHHIDMHMKLLDEETLLVGEFPVGVSDGPQLEQNLVTIMNEEVSVFGDSYRMVRIPMPSSTGGQYPPSASYRTFANNVFLNRTVLVPTYRTEYDTIGLRILGEQLPGYRIVGIDCDSDQNIISQSGAIHCITKTIGVRDPLLIRHQRLVDTYETSDPYAVEAYIRHRSGIESASLFWSTNAGGPFQSLPMVDQGNDSWMAAIPAQPVGTEVYYYVQATSISGKQQVRPMVAPEGWWHFRVLGTSTGIDPEAAEVITDVFPNPAASITCIQLDPSNTPAAQVELLDAIGRRAMLVARGPVPADGRYFVDLTALPSGTYQVMVTSAKGRSVARLLHL